MDFSKMQLMATDDFDVFIKANGEDFILEEYNEAATKQEWKKAISIDDQNVRDYFEDSTREDFAYFQEIHGKEQVLIVADLGLWYGRREGGKHGKLSSLLRSMYEDYNSIYYNPENGTFVLKAVHHDGTNYFTIYKLTKKGIEYLEEEGDYREACELVVETDSMTTRFEIK